MSISATHTRVSKLWQRLSPIPGGKTAFARAVCLIAPYFGSIRPLLTEVSTWRVVATAPKRRAVHNHIGTFHAIAACNLAEFAMGMLMETSLPPSHRWIPKAMTVRYLKKATTSLKAVAEVTQPVLGDGVDFVVPVKLYDTKGVLVMEADITLWVTAAK